MIKKIAFLIAFIFASGAAWSNDWIKTYAPTTVEIFKLLETGKNSPRETEKDRLALSAMYQAVVNSIFESTLVMNSYIKERGGAPFFCIDKKIGDLSYGALANQFEIDLRASINLHQSSDYLVNIAIQVMASRYPCP